VSSLVANRDDTPGSKFQVCHPYWLPGEEFILEWLSTHKALLAVGTNGVQALVRRDWVSSDLPYKLTQGLSRLKTR
jgi:hypothetical protein